MKNIHAKYLANSLAVATAALLVACGGGGSWTAPVTGGSVNYSATCTGGTTVTSTISQADAQGKCPNVGSATLVVSVPVSTYAAVSEEKAAFDLLNAERSRCGFGVLAQNTQLDAAAKGHAEYSVYNYIIGHFQNLQQNPVLFTGAAPNDRAVAAGYVGSVGEDVAYFLTSNKAGAGTVGTRNLLSAPYHLSGVLQGFRDAGVSVRSNTDTNPVGTNSLTAVQFSTGFKSTSQRQLIAADAIATYPCDGSVAVNRKLENESPNPVPGRDLVINPIGTPLYAMARFGNSLNLTSVNLSETLTGTAVVLRPTILKANDPNSYYYSHEGYAAPDAPLKALTQYTVVVNGSNNGVAFKPITYSFTTGN